MKKIFLILFLICVFKNLPSQACPYQDCISNKNGQTGLECYCGSASFNFTKNPKSIYTKISLLELKNCIQIPNDAFTDLQIDQLKIFNSTLAKIEQHAFRGIKTLNTLSLESISNLASLTPDILKYLEQTLTDFILRNVNFTDLNDLSRLKNLLYFSVFYSKFDSINLANLPKLVYLSLQTNSFKKNPSK